MGGDVVHHLDDVLRLGDVEYPCFCRAAPGRDLVGHRLGGPGVEIGHSDVGAFGGEYQRRGAAHAACGAGDQHGQALHGATKLFEIGHRR